MDSKKYKNALNKISELNSKSNVSPTDKGDALVEAVKLLFEDLQYLKYKGDKVKTATSEFDLIYQNSFSDAGAVLNDFGRYIVVECKNWGEKIHAYNVRDFAMKMQKTKVKLGLLFTRVGITGKDSEDAKGEINFLFDKYDIYIVVFDMKELIEMGEPTNTKFCKLLEKKLFRLQFQIKTHI